ncbi:transposase [Streptomyces sp. CA-251251]|uniref:transposase n=1 Tax=Streptomyces sp. CA-251251 TaxID=3240063 RepID=UPI003D8B4986
MALVTVLQCAEGLSDRQAADAVRTRTDWTYALGLALMDTGFWLAERVDLEWFDCYGQRVEEARLPRGRNKQRAWTVQVGADGVRLMTAVVAADAPRMVTMLGPVEVFSVLRPPTGTGHFPHSGWGFLVCQAAVRPDGANVVRGSGVVRR